MLFTWIILKLLTPQTLFAKEPESTLHLQSTIVSQQHPGFRSSYSGQNSLDSGADEQTSITWTIFAGRKLWRGAEFYINPELAGGSGFNNTTGTAGFPNGEISCIGLFRESAL